MNEHNHTPNSLHPSQVKDSKLQAQLKRVYDSFYESPKTMKEVDVSTGIMRESICRYCRCLRLQGKLFAIKKRRCNVTNWNNVTEWTTNPALAPKAVQLNLFES